MSLATVTLKKGEGRFLKAGGAWIFDNEIDTVLGHYSNGDLVLVRDFDGYPMGRGLINANSKIRVRMLTRNIDQEIDQEFLKQRVQAAWDYRKSVMVSEDDLKACRIIFGDADFMPGMGKSCCGCWWKTGDRLCPGLCLWIASGQTARNMWTKMPCPLR